MEKGGTMSNNETIFNSVKARYGELGVDVEKALDKLGSVTLGIHAWQGDDVRGFESDAFTLTGGCLVTGNYPGCARNADELRQDLDLALRLIPGRHKVGLQGHQVDKMFPGVDRDGFTIDNFRSWLDWAKEKKIGMDIAPAFYGHPKLDHNLSLAHPDPAIREFWIRHGINMRKIGEVFGKELGMPAIVNFWMPDGFKDTPADRLAPRQRMMEALDRCFAEKIDPAYERDTVEQKLFGIGVESCTVGSHEFFMLYAATRGKILCFDTGHFHPTEQVGDKLSAVLSMMKEVFLHVSRGVRWDSDHVIVVNDDLLLLAREAVANGYLDRIHFGLDYFDATINRIAAWVIGARDFQKALLIALLEPSCAKEAEKAFDFTSRLALQEASKTLPWGVVWDEFCKRKDVPSDFDFMKEIKAYEKSVLAARS